MIHVDADVARATYRDGAIDDPTPDLPCEKPCPPASNTTDALRQVILRWIGAKETPSRCVLCTPSKCIESWVIKALFPNNSAMRKKGWECHPDPVPQLSTVKKTHRVRKTREDYQTRQDDFRVAWPRVRELSEADRFSRSFLDAIGGNFKA